MTEETMQLRALHDVSMAGDGRTVRGILVPFDVPQRINESLTEGFRSGAFDHQMRAIASRGERVPFAMGHLSPPFNGQVIGSLMNIRNDKAGLYGEARVSDTQAGRDTLQLLHDGALDQLSIGFLPRSNQLDSTGTTWRTKANLTELAVVPRGAYGNGARVTEIRMEACPHCGQLAAVVHELERELKESRALEAAAALAGLPRFDRAEQ